MIQCSSCSNSVWMHGSSCSLPFLLAFAISTKLHWFDFYTIFIPLSIRYKSKIKVLSLTLWSVWAVMLVQLNQATNQAFWISMMSELFRRDYFSCVPSHQNYSRYLLCTDELWDSSSLHNQFNTCQLIHNCLCSSPLLRANYTNTLVSTRDCGLWFPSKLYSTLSPPQNQLWVSLV